MTEESSLVPPLRRKRCAHEVLSRNGKRGKKQCHQEATPDGVLCGLHLRQLGGDSGGKRFEECPFCGLVTAELQRHLPRCPAARHKREREALPYFRLDCNKLVLSAGHEEKTRDERPLGEAIEEGLRRLGVGLPLENHCTEQLGDEAEYQELLAYMQGVHKRHQPKHLRQSLSIARHLLRLIVQEPSKPIRGEEEGGTVEATAAKGRAFADMGCGRGSLSHVLLWVLSRDCPEWLPSSHWLLVDVARTKTKEERCDLWRSAASASRVYADLKDVLFPLLFPSDKPLHVYTKHLCGSATDLCLRAALSSGLSVGPSVYALCCYHRITWDDFLGTPVLSSLGFSRASFQALIREASRFVTAPAASLGPLPLLATELLDAARILAIRQLGFSSHLLHYVDPAITPSNRLLVITPPRSLTSSPSSTFCPSSPSSSSRWLALPVSYV